MGLVHELPERLSMTYLGIICAVGSALFNGSFAALFKTKEMSALNVHPMVFQLYVSIGVFLSSWAVVPFLGRNPDLLPGGDDGDAVAGDELKFSSLGLVGGCLLVLAFVGSFNAVDDIGIALAQGIWSGVAMVVSYVWGAVIFGERPSRVGASVSGLALLILGVIFIAFSDAIGRRVVRLGGYTQVPDAATNLDPEDDVDFLKQSVPATPMAGEKKSASSYARGVSWACSVGLFGGSILAPLHYVPPDRQGLVFLPSFGIGALLTSPAAFYAHAVYSGGMPELHVRKALGTGLLSGLLWNVGNVLSVVAISSVGYGVAYPLFQCALLFSGVWGIYLFHEITDRATIFVFWFGGLVLVLGGFLLAASQ